VARLPDDGVAVVRGELFGTDHAADDGGGEARMRVHATNSRVVRAELAPDRPVLARYGAIVASSGAVEYHPHRQGAGTVVRRAVTGEGLALMEITGTGDVWLGDGGHAEVVQVDPGDWLSVNSRYALGYTPELRYEIRTVPGASMLAGGLTNTLITAAGGEPGWLALSSPAPPLVIPVSPDRPASVDPARVIGWSAQLHASIDRARDLGWAIRGGHLLHFVFSGTGFVIVTPGVPAAPPQSGGGSAAGNIAGNIATSMITPG
jgi:uncharacterized protein (AIM24 family)